MNTAPAPSIYTLRVLLSIHVVTSGRSGVDRTYTVIHKVKGGKWLFNSEGTCYKRRERKRDGYICSMNTAARILLSLVIAIATRI